MSQENVELVRQGYEAFAQGDIEAALAMFDPEIRIEDHDRSLETPTTYEGRDGFLSLFATVNEGFADVRYILQDVTEVGDRVLVEVRRTGRGRASVPTFQTLLGDQFGSRKPNPPRNQPSDAHKLRKSGA